MAQPAPAPKTAPDATVNIDANGQVTINQGGQPYISVPNNESITIGFTYPPGYAECKLKLKFHEWKQSPAANGGTVVVGS
jgi:hypothetical protein